MRPALDHESLLVAVEQLSRSDKALGEVVRRLGPPPLWRRRPGFATLVRIILEQQVSLASGAAAYARLRRAVGRVEARRVAAASVADLRSAGLTRQKAAYCRDLARRVDSGRLDLRAVAAAGDQEARERLLAVRGIGPWTADIYLLMALGRPDVWPDGDLALAQAARQVKGLRTLPGRERLRRLASAWRPWRAVAARVLWHHYLAARRPGQSG